jgi:pilus assembly protein CpaD
MLWSKTGMIRAPLAATLAVTAMALVACASPHGPGDRLATAKPAKAENPTLDPKPRTDLDRYRAAIIENDGELALAQHPGGRLSDAQKTALLSLVQTSSDPAAAYVVRTANGEPAFGDAALTAQAAVELLRSAGVAPSRIQLGRYDAQGTGAPIKISYRAAQAIGPDCRNGWDDLSATGANRVYGHFGCAATSNLAAMIANPRDLQHPAAEDPSDATRRGVVLGKYRKGEPTSSTKDDQASGAVSTAVK